jgi:hypothetical protein
MDWSTLAGVVVGGAISLASAYLLEWRRDRAAAARATAVDQEELRTAARLVQAELIHAMGEIEGTMHAIRYPLTGELPLGHWDEHAATLARLLPALDWGQVLVAAGRVTEMNRDFHYAMRDEASEQELRDLEDHHKEISDAVEVLWTVRGDRPSSRH